jgi:hypothetical protein
VCGGVLSTSSEPHITVLAVLSKYYISLKRGLLAEQTMPSEGSRVTGERLPSLCSQVTGPPHPAEPPQST